MIIIALCVFCKGISYIYSSGLMKHWYHIDCLLDSFKTQRATTKSIETIDDISGWETIGDLDKDLIMEKLEQLPKFNKNSGASIAAGTSSNVRNCLCLCFGFQFFV